MERLPILRDGKTIWIEQPNYESRVRAFEIQGMTRSDAQGTADAEDLAAWQLVNDPPKHSPQRFDNAEHERQRTLVDGMDCLPGQLDLF